MRSWQKQVGQTIVQFVQVRHRDPTSSQRGCSRLRWSSAGEVVGLQGPAHTVGCDLGRDAVRGRLLRRRRPSRACSWSSSSAPVAVPASAVNPSSSSVRATSKPLEQRGPVPIETQKQVSPGASQFTPMKHGLLATGPVGGVGDQEDLVLDLDRRQVARPEADERVANVGQRRGRDRDRARRRRGDRSGSSRAAGRGTASRRRARAPTRRAGRRRSARGGTRPGPGSRARRAAGRRRRRSDRARWRRRAPSDRSAGSPARTAATASGRSHHGRGSAPGPSVAFADIFTRKPASRDPA